MKIALSILFSILLASCAPTPDKIARQIEATISSIPTSTALPTYTPNPTYTPYPTQTLQPTVVITRVVIRTPAPDSSNMDCRPILKMDYSDNSKISILLQAYVADFPQVKTVSYVIPEKIYSNSLSQLYYVTYIDKDDGEIYSKRYIAYVREFGWKTGVFSIDGQCWIHGPR